MLGEDHEFMLSFIQEIFAEYQPHARCFLDTGHTVVTRRDSLVLKDLTFYWGRATVGKRN